MSFFPSACSDGVFEKHTQSYPQKSRGFHFVLKRSVKIVMMTMIEATTSGIIHEVVTFRRVHPHVLAYREDRCKEENGMEESLYGLYPTRLECAKMWPKSVGFADTHRHVTHHAGMGRKNDIIKSPVYHRRIQVREFLCYTIFVAIA